MTAFISQIRLPAIIGALVVLPFAILEAISVRSLARLPLPLFVSLWLLVVTFILTLRPLVRSVRVKGSQQVPLYRQLPGIVLMILCASLWVSLVLDRMPCFLGVPNCD